MMYKWRKNKTVGPTWIPEEVWVNWVGKWAEQGFQHHSNVMSVNWHMKNDGPGTGPSIHMEGSRAFFDHNRKTAKELGRQPTLPKLHQRLHTSKATQAWVDERSRQIADVVQQPLLEEVQAATQAQYGQEGDVQPSVVNEDAIYLCVLGNVDKRQRNIYWIGSRCVDYQAGSSSHPKQSLLLTEDCVREIIREEI